MAGKQKCYNGHPVVYQPFSGGEEWYCETCQDTGPYGEGAAPRRVQMLRDGRIEELRQEMEKHLDGQ